jgi:hypothetical protein
VARCVYHTTVQVPIRNREKINRLAQLLLEYPLGISQLPFQGACRQPRQVHVVVAVRLKRHARALHLKDLSPTQKPWFADGGGIHKEIGLYSGFKKKWVGDFVG